jgi:hypothetical protein
MSVPTEKFVSFEGRNFKLHSVPYDGSTTTFKTDQSATAVAVIEPASSQPTVSLGAADSDFLKTVTVAAGGQSLGGAITVIIAHGLTIASRKN